MSDSSPSKSPQFLDPPAEIRVEIYKFTLASALSTGRISYYMGLYLSCHQIYDEIRYELFRGIKTDIKSIDTGGYTFDLEIGDLELLNTVRLIVHLPKVRTAYQKQMVIPAPRRSPCLALLSY
jgi:hypothetical protein